MIRFDVKDKKLLTALDEDARLTNTQLAKRVGLSKPAVEYRLKRFEKNGVIFAHYAVIDFTKLGFSQYKVYFKFQNASVEDEEKMTKYWVNDSSSVWVGQIRGRWDLAVSILARNNFEFGKILDEFMNKYSRFILEKDVLLTEYSPIYAREYLSETKKSEFVYGVPSEIRTLDEVDKKILSELSNNARISIVDFVEKSELSRDVISYRMKKLVDEGIIVSYRTYLNLAVIGVRHYKVIMRMKNFNVEAEKKVWDYVSKHSKATQFLKLIGSWDLEIEFETESEDELYEILTDFRKKFSDVIRDYDIIRITSTEKLDYFSGEKF